MKTNRSKLFSILEQAKPALAVREIIPGLSNFWFNGHTVTAYNDIIGIEAPCETDFAGGVSGKLLMGFLEKTATEEVSLNMTGEEALTATAGRSHMMIPLVEMERCPWVFPEFEREYSFKITKELIQALKWVLISIGKASALPDQLGVTLIADKSFLNLYTTDAKTISWMKLPLPEDYDEERIIISSDFCDELLHLSSVGDDIYPTENSVITENESGVKLFSRLLEAEHPLDFAGAVRRAITKGGDLLDIPDGLSMALERIDLIRDGRNAEPAQIIIRDSQLDLYVQTPLGEVKDRLDLEGEHKDVSVKLDPTLVSRALSDRKNFCLTSNFMILQGPEEFIHLISTLQK